MFLFDHPVQGRRGEKMRGKLSTVLAGASVCIYAKKAGATPWALGYKSLAALEA